jgi:hypothetical protein
VKSTIGAMPRNSSFGVIIIARIGKAGTSRRVQVSRGSIVYMAPRSLADPELRRRRRSVESRSRARKVRGENLHVQTTTVAGSCQQSAASRRPAAINF